MENNKTIIISLAIILIVLFISCASEPSKAPSAESLQIQYADNNYNNGLSQLKNKDYSNASTSFISFKTNQALAAKYPDGKFLYAYAEAMSTKDISMKQHYLNDIPDTYSGAFADEIKQAKTKIPQEEQEAKKAKAKEEKERESHLYIGDPEYKVEQVFGEPDRINKTVTESHIRKQYVYPNGHYIYVDDGVVTTFQN